MREELGTQGRGGSKLAKTLNSKEEFKSAGDFSIMIFGEDYAKYVDQGTNPRTKLPPIDKIQQWLNKKGLGDVSAWAVAQSIKKHGTPTKKGIVQRDKLNFIDKAVKKVDVFGEIERRLAKEIEIDISNAAKELR